MLTISNSFCWVNLSLRVSYSNPHVHQSCPCRGVAERHPCSREGGEAERKAWKDIDTYTYPVVVSAVDISWHAKVSNLYQQVLTHQAVPFGQQTQWDSIKMFHIAELKWRVLNYNHISYYMVITMTVLLIISSWLFTGSANSYSPPC